MDDLPLDGGSGMTNHHANDAVPTIGSATERRIQMAFDDACLLTAKATAKLLGIDEGTLRTMAETGVIRSVRRGAGSVRAYTEGDIRAFLTESAAPCPSTSQPRARTSNTTSRSKVVGFMDRRALARAGRLKK